MNQQYKFTKSTVICFLTLILSCFAIQQSNAAIIITGQAASSASLGDKDGAVLTIANRVEIGWYNSAPTTLQFSTYTSASQFLTGWNSVQTGGAQAFGIDGLALNSIELPNGDSSLNGKQMYFIAGNGSLLSNSTQLFIMTSSSWVVPTNNNTIVADPFSFDVSDSGATLLWGSFALGAGVSYEDPDLGTVTLDEYRTALVPEPSTGALMMIGAVGLVALRRLRKV